MAGFKPTTQYFYLGEVKYFIEQLKKKELKRCRTKDVELKEAIGKEIDYFKGDQEKIKLDQENQKQETDLEFIIDQYDDFETTNDEIIQKIEREVYKNEEQKEEDFINMDPNLPMINGGNNDVYQAIMQCFCTMTVFVGYFMKGQHIKAKIQNNSRINITGKIALIFESLYR